MENLNTNIVASIFYITIGLISIVMYSKANNNYNNKTSQIHSYKSFMYIYKILQISTLIICVSSLWNDYSILYKLYHNNDFLIYLGISISGLGISMFSIARFSLGKNYSPCYDSFLPKSINTKGIYSVIRHPIYTANLILMLGIFLSSGSALILINTLILFIYYLLSAFVEEKAILKKFPKYRKYKSDTGMFLPNIIKS